MFPQCILVAAGGRPAPPADADRDEGHQPRTHEVLRLHGLRAASGHCRAQRR